MACDVEQKVETRDAYLFFAHLTLARTGLSSGLIWVSTYKTGSMVRLDQKDECIVKMEKN